MAANLWLGIRHTNQISLSHPLPQTSPLLSSPKTSWQLQYQSKLSITLSSTNPISSAKPISLTLLHRCSLELFSSHMPSSTSLRFWEAEACAMVRLASRKSSRRQSKFKRFHLRAPNLSPLPPLPPPVLMMRAPLIKSYLASLEDSPEARRGS